MLIACRDCGSIQRLGVPPPGRSVDAPLACAITTTRLLLAANSVRVMTVRVAGIAQQRKADQRQYYSG
ncbi:MAG TPA: hypothetical protein VFE12_10030 [Acetobacteraceae bacterium]|nr:hypothetical protein [Acetobacteraceae bacterium]